ncbi:MAG: hypothetical protein V8R82_10285 [Clostridia bacterium]
MGQNGSGKSTILKITSKTGKRRQWNY